jgi:hypothetical protein
MSQKPGALLGAQVLLTIAAMEFFGPIVRDFSPSHALNPQWVGHARVHLVWALGFMFFSGLANLWLIWMRKPFDLGNLRLSFVWQSCNLAGFWTSYVLLGAYDGIMTLPDTHVQIMGYDENVVAFSVFSIILASAGLLLRRARLVMEPV